MTEQLHNEGSSSETPMVFSGVAARWYPLDEAAEILNTTGETLRLFVRGVKGRPVLASREIDGRTCVQPGPARLHLKLHAPRCRGLVDPPGYGVQASAPDDPAAVFLHPEVRKLLNGQNPLDANPDEFLLRLGCSNVPEERVRVITQAMRAIQNARSIELRAGKAFPPDDVVKMLRAHGDLLVETVDETAAAFSSELLKWILAAAGVNLAEKMTEAQQRLENEIREHFGNAIIRNIRKKVEDQIRGVRDLEFTQPVKEPA